MYVAVVPNRGSPPAILLRESYREAGKTKNRTLANLSRWPAERIEQLRAVLRGAKLLPAAEAVEIVRALPHGHVLAALDTARHIALDTVLPRRAPQRRRDLALALIVARLLEPAAKLATARMLDPATASHSLGEMLGLGKVAAKEVYAALDWLGREQPFIEATLARRHLKEGALLLYDVTSTYLEGRCCELAQHGYSRDHRGDRPQIVIGLMCAADGCPVAVEVFEGNTADPVTLAAQIDKLRQRFKLQRVVMVGDRGVLTSARIEQTLRPAGLDWITALRAPAIKQLAAAGGPLQPSLFDDRDMAEITSLDYPGERLVVCKNPLLAEERARKRAELLAATEKELARIAARVQRARSPLHGAAAIGQAVGAVLGRRHMAKHFHIGITDDTFSFAQDPLSIAAEAALDGIYVVRTNLPAEHSDKVLAVLHPPSAAHARIMEKAGCEALFVSTGGVVGAYTGLADVGTATMTECVTIAGWIADSISIPVIMDGDTGHGGIMAVRRMVRECIRAGIAGIRIDDQPIESKRKTQSAGVEVVPLDQAIARYRAAVDMKNELDPNFVVMAQCYARDASDGTLEDTIARLLAYRDEAGVDWVQFESPHSVDEIRAARAAVTWPFSFMKGKLGRYLDLDEHLALGVTIAWYPGFTHHVTWAVLWDFMTAFQSGGVKAWDAFVESRRDRPYPLPEVPDDGEGSEKQRVLEKRYFSSGDRRR